MIEIKIYAYHINFIQNQDLFYSIFPICPSSLVNGLAQYQLLLIFSQYFVAFISKSQLTVPQGAH